jgi:hypothetical protein
VTEPHDPAGTPPGGPSPENPDQTEQQPSWAWRGGPPADWVERVRRAAPHLLDPGGGHPASLWHGQAGPEPVAPPDPGAIELSASAPRSSRGPEPAPPALGPSRDASPLGFPRAADASPDSGDLQVPGNNRPGHPAEVPAQSFPPPTHGSGIAARPDLVIPPPAAVRRGGALDVAGVGEHHDARPLPVTSVETSTGAGPLTLAGEVANSTPPDPIAAAGLVGSRPLHDLSVPRAPARATAPLKRVEASPPATHQSTAAPLQIGDTPPLRAPLEAIPVTPRWLAPHGPLAFPATTSRPNRPQPSLPPAPEQAPDRPWASLPGEEAGPGPTSSGRWPALLPQLGPDVVEPAIGLSRDARWARLRREQRGL